MMIRKSLVIGAMILGLAAPSCEPAYAGPPESPACKPIHEQALYTVVMVQTAAGSGSGTVVWSGQRDGEAQTYILTNNHVIQSAVTVEDGWDPKEGKDTKKERKQPVRVLWFDYNDCSRNVGTHGKIADIVAYDKAADLALLEIRDHEQTVSPVAVMMPKGEKLQLADELWAMGSGLGQPPFVSYGLLSFQDRQFNGYRYILSSTPIIFGNSGGALFARKQGRFVFVGVPAMISAAGWGIPVTHMAWSVSLDTIRGFLKDQGFGFVLGEEDSKDAKDADN